MRLADFDFELPPESIAQEPLPDRAASRMLVLHRKEQRWEDRSFREFPEFLTKNDCLILNNSEVFPSRLYADRGQVFLLRALTDDRKTWSALVRPGRRMQPGQRLRFGEVEAVILDAAPYGERTLRFETDLPVDDLLREIGHVPLPPYIRRGDTAQDKERYQTVFARERGSVAAPTAGLHFTPEILTACQDAGAKIAYVTLHVGLGTFQPLREEQVEVNHLHSEQFQITPEGLNAIRSAQRRICVGTTSVRAVESALAGREGDTDLFIQPGFAFRGTDAILTNFHLPRSSLLILIAAFAGRDFVLAAYKHAVEARYRFYSYGDCMFIL